MWNIYVDFLSFQTVSALANKNLQSHVNTRPLKFWKETLALLCNVSNFTCNFYSILLETSKIFCLSFKMEILFIILFACNILLIEVLQFLVFFVCFFSDFIYFLVGSEENLLNVITNMHFFLYGTVWVALLLCFKLLLSAYIIRFCLMLPSIHDFWHGSL